MTTILIIIISICLAVESEVPFSFAIWFCVNKGLVVFISMKINNKFCLYKRCFEIESKFFDLEAESMVKKEDIHC